MEVAEARSKQAEARLINVQEAANILCIRVGTLYNWISSRRVPFVRVGGSVRFDPQDIKKLIDKGRVAIWSDGTKSD